MNKVKSKCDKAKAKIASKVAKGKAKVAKKCAKACALAFALLVVCGCQNPAQRAQTADTKILIYGGTVTFGSEFVSLAQANETGGDDAGMTASPTNDIKPDVDVKVGSTGTGGILETAAAAGVQKLLAPSASATGVGSTATVSSSSCDGGNCTYGDCTDGSCTPE